MIKMQSFMDDTHDAHCRAAKPRENTYRLNDFRGQAQRGEGLALSFQLNRKGSRFVLGE